MQLSAPTEPQLINIVIGISIKVQSVGEQTSGLGSFCFRASLNPGNLARARCLRNDA
jgi:hypothetical protein